MMNPSPVPLGLLMIKNELKRSWGPGGQNTGGRGIVQRVGEVTFAIAPTGTDWGCEMHGLRGYPSCPGHHRIKALGFCSGGNDDQLYRLLSQRVLR